MAQLEQENLRLRQMYLKLSLEHSALQEMVLAVAMRRGSTTEANLVPEGPAAALAQSKIR